MKHRVHISTHRQNSAACIGATVQYYCGRCGKSMRGTSRANGTQSIQCRLLCRRNKIFWRKSRLVEHKLKYAKRPIIGFIRTEDFEGDVPPIKLLVPPFRLLLFASYPIATSLRTCGWKDLPHTYHLNI